ncbi:hypothetical protein ACT4US_14105, partial [Bacillus sp. HC-Mk]
MFQLLFLKFLCRYTGKQYLQLPVVSLIRQLPLTGTKPVGNHIFLTSGFGNLFCRYTQFGTSIPE